MGIYNRAAFMLTLFRDHIFKSRTPLVVVLNVTFRCNLRCGYCYGQYFDRQDEDFKTDELLSLIDGLAKLGTRSITLGGGEPLIRDDIGLIVERIKKNKIECGFNTNGILVGKRIESLKKADMICVSIDGPKEKNDLNRGAGSFEKIMAGIDAALAAGIKVHTTTVITRYNYDAVDWVVEMARNKGIQAEFNFLFNQSEGKTDSDSFMADNQKLKAAANRIADLKAKGAPILFSEKVYRYVADWPDFSQRIILGKTPDFDYIPCSAGRFMMFIDADGKVYPCVQLIDVFKALDFRQSGLKAAWDNCGQHQCRACYFPCFNEFNSIMTLNPKVIASQVINTIKGR
ncbi:MAG: radical SAM protein [Candidatus Omnitrophica bacterium]|nr:radical SAM protein [Candidatus Omnitrophota bacterium]